MVSPNNHQPSILTSSTGIRLQRERVKAGNGTQQVTQIVKHFLKKQKIIIYQEIIYLKHQTDYVSKSFVHNRRCSNSYLIPLSLVSGDKRVDVSEAWPCHWHHFGCCIQFHCTRSQWNHTVAQ